MKSAKVIAAIVAMASVLGHVYTASKSCISGRINKGMTREGWTTKRKDGKREYVGAFMYYPRVDSTGVATMKNGRTYQITRDGWRAVA